MKLQHSQKIKKAKKRMYLTSDLNWFQKLLFHRLRPSQSEE